MPGPIPAPESTLARPRARKGGDQQEVTTGIRQPVTWELPANPEWHPIAKLLYESVANSGQSDFYQDSDWAILYSLCDDISYYKSESKMYVVDKKTGEVKEYPKPRSGQMLQAIMSNLTSLLLTEGERRRVRLELQEPPKPRADLRILAMEDYRDLTDG